MKAKLTQNYISKLKPKDKIYDIYDDTIRWLFLRVDPSGKMNWHLRYGHRTTKIGPAEILTPSQAREKAQTFLSEYHMTGISPKDKNKNKITTIGELLNEYKQVTPSKYILEKITPYFELSMKLETITDIWAEKWRQQYIAAHKCKICTANRPISALKTLLTWGEKHNLCRNTLAAVSKLKETDSDTIIRYLTPDEETKLLKSLQSFNLAFQVYIIVAMNTGIRKSALLNLSWQDVNLQEQTIILRASSAKNRRTNILPMNQTVYNAISQLPHVGEYIFTNPQTKERYYSFERQWKSLLKLSQIKNLRFHDLRHNFASQLVMKGVDLNTVRELMTHSDIKMTLRYAHLAPNIKKKAVDLLDK